MKIVNISSDYIKLDQFLKLVNISNSGSDAKFLIKENDIYVNGEIEKRRGRKLKNGDIVKYFSSEFHIKNSV